MSKNKMEDQIKWKLERAAIIDVSVRLKKRIYEDGGDEYAVIHVGSHDDLDELLNPVLSGRGKRRTFVKFLTLMCFKEKIFLHLVEKETYSFEGKVSFGFGSTYFKIEKAFDSLGFKVGDGGSIGEIQFPDEL